MKTQTKMSNKSIMLYNETSQSNYEFNTIKAWLDDCGFTSLHNEGIAVVPVVGELNGAGQGYFNSTYDNITSQLSKAINDGEVKGIMLLINSPGGAATGMFQCSEEIRKADAIKPVHAYIAYEGTSAAYGLASNARHIAIAQDAITGSIGCIGRATAVSEEYLKKEGILSRLFRSKNAPQKCESPFESKEAEARYQAEVDAIGDKFLALCASNRNVEIDTAKETFGKGAILTADEALSVGMVDSIEGFTEAINRLASSLTDEKEETECEGVDDMDINAMSADERLALFNDLVAIQPELLNDARATERARIGALNAMRDGSAEVGAIVDNAISNGLSCESIAMDCLNAVKANVQKKAEEKENNLQALAKATESVATPMENSAENEAMSLAEKINIRRAR